MFTVMTLSDEVQKGGRRVKAVKQKDEIANRACSKESSVLPYAKDGPRSVNWIQIWRSVRKEWIGMAKLGLQGGRLQKRRQTHCADLDWQRKQCMHASFSLSVKHVVDSFG